MDLSGGGGNSTAAAVASPPQSVITALLQQMEILQRSGYSQEDIISLLTAKINQDTTSSTINIGGGGPSSNILNTILPSPSSSISSPSTSSNLMSNLPTPTIGAIYSTNNQQTQQQQFSNQNFHQQQMTNISASNSIYSNSTNNINNPLSPPSIIPSPSSAFSMPSGISAGTSAAMSSGIGAAATNMSGMPSPTLQQLAAMGQFQPSSEIAKLLESFSLTNIFQQHVHQQQQQQAQAQTTIGNLNNLQQINFHQHQQQLSSNLNNTNIASPRSSNNDYIIPSSSSSATMNTQIVYPQPQTPASVVSQIYQSSSISFSQPPSASTSNLPQSNNYMPLSNTTDDDDDEPSSVSDHHHRFQDTPQQSSRKISGGGGSQQPLKRKRKTKQPQFDENGKLIIQRIRRRRRNGEIPEEDDAPPNLSKITPPGCRKQQPPSLPDNEQSQTLITPDDPIIHSPPSLRQNQAATAAAAAAIQQQQQQQHSQMQQSFMQCQPQTQNDISNHLNSISAAATPLPQNNYSSIDSPNSNNNNFNRSDSLSGEDEASKLRRSKICRVCGDIATGYNFNVITCESCKAFFRRNANRMKLQGDFKCPYSDDCEINAVSRRFCQKCRLKKCFSVGMKREWILNDDQLRRRKNSRLNHNIKSSSGGRSPPDSVRSQQQQPLSPQDQRRQSPPPTQQQLKKSHQKHQQRQSKVVSKNISSSSIDVVVPQSIISSNRNNNNESSMNFGGIINRTISSVRSSMDVTSPSSTTNNDSNPMSLSMISPVNSISPSGSVMSTSTPPQISPKLEPQEATAYGNIKTLNLHDILIAYQRHFASGSYQIPTPQPNTLMAKIIVTQASRLLPTILLQYFGCGGGDILKISMPMTDYLQLINHCGGNKQQNLQNYGGEIILPEEGYEVLKGIFQSYLNQTIQQPQPQNSQPPQISPSISARNMQISGGNIQVPLTSNTPQILQSPAIINPLLLSSSCATQQQLHTPTMTTTSSSSQPLPMVQVKTEYFPNHPPPVVAVAAPPPQLNEIRTTTLLTSTMPQYDDRTSYNVGPTPEVDPALLPDKMRQQYFMIHNAINEEFENPQTVDSKLISPTPNSNNPILNLRNIQQPKIILNAAEIRELDSIRNAFACLDEPLTDLKAAATLQKVTHNPSDIMNIMDVTIRRFVKCAKKLLHFQEVSNDGKLILLKSSMIDMLTIRGVMLLDEKMESWNSPILKSGATVSVNMFDKLTDPMQRKRFMTFCSAIHPTLRKNSMAIMLIALIVLFDDSRAIKLNDDDRAIVRQYHEVYYHLLNRYVESVYNEDAPNMIKTIPIALQRLAKTSATSINLFLGRVQNKDVAQLPTEFFKTESINGNSITTTYRDSRVVDTSNTEASSGPS